MKVMTKREMKKMETKLVLELLTNKFNVESFDDEGFGSFTFNVNDLQFQLDRRDYCVSGFDSIPLANGGAGFPQETIDRNIQSIRLENQMQSAIEELFSTPIK
jgi:hypothetical protein